MVHFHSEFIHEARKLLRQGNISISFHKGSPTTYFIISGIVSKGRPYESKVVYKKRLEKTNQSPVSSNCNCAQWSKDGHCSHTAALFLFFYLKHLYNLTSDDESTPALPTLDGFGVAPNAYGTIISSPRALSGAMSHSSYSSLQYILHNKKIITFPAPETFQGKLLVCISHNGEITFQWKNQTDDVIKEISLFESLYLFDWSGGRCYQLPRTLQILIRKIRISDVSVNDLLNSFNQDPSWELMIDDTASTEIPTSPASCQIHISKGEKGKLLKLSIFFVNDQNVTISIPRSLSAFSFDGGQLGHFRKKNDAYDFISTHINNFESFENYKTSLTSVSNKDFWITLIESLHRHEETKIYHESSRSIYSFSNYFLKKLFYELYSNFNEILFRFSKYDCELNELSYQISASNLFSSLSAFQQTLAPFGTTVYYERSELAVWSSQIRFERRNKLGSWFDLELNIDDDDLEIITQANIDNGLALTKKGLILLTKQQKDLLRFMQKYTQYEKEEHQSKDNSHKFVIPFNRNRIFELFHLKKMGIPGALTPQEEEICRKLETLQEIPKYPIPELLQNIARPYQKVGHHWLRFLYEHRLGACLADDMGLGKTLQALSFIQSIEEQISQVLVICPVSIILNWENEINKFSTLSSHIYHGGSRSIPDDKQIIITSYGVMKKECDTTFASKKFDILIFDEVQYLKNIRSQGAHAARKLNADFRICLTGTPVENDLSEFYNIIDLCVPGIWGDLQFIRTTSNKKTRLLARKTAKPFILRRTKDQVLTDLPPKIEQTALLTLSENEQERYNNKLTEIRFRIKNSLSKRKFGEILKGLLELRQLCLWQQHERLNSTKILFLTENIKQIMDEGHQAIIFSQFTTYLNIIQQEINKRHWKIARIDGSQSIKKRQEQVDLFQKGDAKIFLISLKAGGVGINLTAASYVFLMDPWWNPAVETQAIDRAHRIGQENTLTVYRPIIKNSVEEKVLELQKYKRELFNDLLRTDSGDDFSGKLSMNDFEFLIGD